MRRPCSSPSMTAAAIAAESSWTVVAAILISFSFPPTSPIGAWTYKTSPVIESEASALAGRHLLWPSYLCPPAMERNALCIAGDIIIIVPFFPRAAQGCLEMVGRPLPSHSGAGAGGLACSLTEKLDPSPACPHGHGW